MRPHAEVPRRARACRRRDPCARGRRSAAAPARRRSECRRRRRAAAGHRRRSTSPSGRAKRPSQAPDDGPSVSQVWYDDDEDLRRAHARSAKKSTSPSTTDMSLYDEPPPRKRWPLLVGVLARARGRWHDRVRGDPRRPDDEDRAAGGRLHSGRGRRRRPTPHRRRSSTNDTGSAAGSAAVATGSATTAIAKVDPKPDPKTAHPTHAGRAPARHGAAARQWQVDFSSSDDLARRRPGGPNTTTTDVSTNPTNTVVTVPKDTNKGNGASGVSGTEGPQDPYGDRRHGRRPGRRRGPRQEGRVLREPRPAATVSATRPARPPASRRPPSSTPRTSTR